MKIAMLGQKRIPSREGGVEVVVEELASRMVALGHSVTVYNRRSRRADEADKKNDNTNKTRDKTYRGIQIRTVPTWDRMGLAAVTSSIAASFRIAFQQYDVVHFHAEGPCAMLWLPRLAGKRCVVTIHGLDWKREKWGGSRGIASRYIKLGEKIAAKYADEIIVLSKNMQNYFADVYGRETTFIPNGVTLPTPCPAQEITRKFGLEKASYLLFVGRMVPEKGLRALIEAFRGVRTDKKLVIAGGAGDMKSFYEELKQLAVPDDRIMFLGFVQGQVLEELYSNAYVYVLPSDLEGMPLTLLEAMSYGNCCLVSDIPECTEVVGEQAHVFRRGDVGELRRSMQYLCDNPAYVQRLRSQSASFICEKYNWDDITARTLELYEKGMAK